MKRIIYIVLSIFLGTGAVSCDAFLDLEPKAAVTPNVYLNTEDQLAAYGAAKYSLFRTPAGYSGIGQYGYDNNSDNQTSQSSNGNFILGQKTVGQSGGAWNFESIRDCNYFFEDVLPKYREGKISGVTNNIRHYIGEMYFFRAYIYFSKLTAVGDFPIITKVLDDNYSELVEANKRRPRNEVARFILSDLDSAILYMQPAAPASNRLTRNAALLFKSRVALYEGTWLKYHAGTARVPGGPDWPGANADYLADFTIDLNREIDFFLTQAMTAADEVASSIALYDDYAGMFRMANLNTVPEVLLFRAYSLEEKVSHYVQSYLQSNGGGNTGFSRSLVESFLMTSGLPIYADAVYKGDETLEDVLHDRDIRLTSSVLVAGDQLRPDFYFEKPDLTGGDAEVRTTTGYSIKKGLVNTEYLINVQYVSPCIIFRVAEAYLNYIEADYVKNGSLDGKSREYWQALRRRAGVDTDFNNTIAHTDLSRERDLAKYSGSNPVDATLYNIRRERRCEFIAEGMRKDDLYRWRALDQMLRYYIEGINLWDEMYKLYDNLKPEGESDAPNVSTRSYKYLRPLSINRNNLAFGGYNFPQAHYLDPIAYYHFTKSTPKEGGDVTTSVIYQNPGWKIEVGSKAEY